MPSRLELYYQLLEESLDRGYEVHSIISFWQVIKKAQLCPDSKYLILRHDVDTDPSTAEAQWEIEQSFNVQSSYYFRFSTLDIPLMQKIAQAGFEVSYHYEEIATVAKERCLKSRKQVEQEMPYIRERFKENLTVLREKSELPMITVASHGDFMNQKLKMPNLEILKDQALRREVGIELEVYDQAMMKHVTSRHSDAPYPRFWQPDNPLEAIRRGEAVVYLLTHPRHWRSNPREYLLVDAKRVWEDLRYSLCSS